MKETTNKGIAMMRTALDGLLAKNKSAELIQVETKPQPMSAPLEETPHSDAVAVPGWLKAALADADNVANAGIHAVINDGVTHVNIGGRTELGALLSHFARTPFIHPYYGPFNSMEGFWHYIRATEPNDALRGLSGLSAKNFGKKLERRNIRQFHDLIKDANYHRIKQNPELHDLFVGSDLPLDHYYLYGEGHLLIRPAGYTWILTGFESIRKMLREDTPPPKLNYELVEW